MRYAPYGNFDLQRGDHDGNTRTNTPPRWSSGTRYWWAGGSFFEPSGSECSDDNPPPVDLNNPWGGASLNRPLVPSFLAEAQALTCTVRIPQYVQDLQRDLRELGFLIIKGDRFGNILNDDDNAAGVFGRTTEWAVKEFQIYASMTHVAQLNVLRLREITGSPPEAEPSVGEVAWAVAELRQVPSDVSLPAGVTPHPVSVYVASLDQVENAARYTGPISGVVNEETRRAIRFWVLNRYRCPVVVEAWSMANNQRSALFADGVNIWEYNAVASTRPRMFFRDFSRYYTYPAERSQEQYQVLGDYTMFQNHAGPRSEPPNHTWGMNGNINGTELLPENLIDAGTTLASLQQNLGGAAASTFRVLRAVSEQECMGYFDSVNSYDVAVVSIGPCHWTFALSPAGGNYNSGELAGFLAYFRNRFPDDYRTAVGNFGLFPENAWSARSANSPRGTGPMWRGGQRKYEGWYLTHYSEPATEQTLAGVRRGIEDVFYYKSWHWFFRWVMAGRVVPGYRYAMWDMFRIRVQDIRDIQVDITVTIPPQAGQPPQQVRVQGSLGQIFTSEKGIAFLARVHILGPAHVTAATGRLHTAIREAIAQNPALNWAQPLNQWGDREEAALCGRLLNQWPATGNSFGETLNAVDNWPNYTGRNGRGYLLREQLGVLRSARNSFVFDASGI